MFITKNPLIITANSIQEAKSWLEEHSSETDQEKVKNYAGDKEFSRKSIAFRVQNLVKAGLNSNTELDGFIERDNYSGRHYPLSMPLLCRAILDGQTDLVRTLVETGADINKKSSNGETPLFIASQINKLEILKLLLENGAEVDQTTNSGHTALHAACTEGHEEIALTLIEWGASPIKEHIRDKSQSPLTLALRKGHVELAKKILEFPESLQYVGENCFPLLAAVSINNSNADDKLELFAINLLRLGANPHISLLEPPCETPWLAAAMNGKVKFIQKTLEKYPDSLNRQAGPIKRTALQMAARWGHKTTVQLLLKHKAHTDYKDINGDTAESLARREHHHDIADLIAEARKQINCS